MFPSCRHSVPIVTGVIYVVIIALWAAVLIPIWLRRHDRISEVRSTARFSSAMKTLGGRGRLTPAFSEGGHADDYFTASTTGRGYGTAPRRRTDPEARMRRGDETRQSSGYDFEGMDPSYERELVRRSAATRRAVVLGTLTALLLLALILAIVGVLPQWLPILTAVPVVAFVLATALTASSRSTASATTRRAPAPRRRAAPESAVASASAEDDWESWNAWDDEDSWEAVPTTLPTYVTAPRASAVPRGIDKAHPGEWTGEAMVETARAMRTRPTGSAVGSAGDVDFSAETAEIPVVSYDSRRAANQ
jgi:hypothetical protein